jgi:hypothetical protein
MLANYINGMAAKPVLSSPKGIKGLSATCKTASLARNAPVTAVISLEGYRQTQRFQRLVTFSRGKNSPKRNESVTGGDCPALTQGSPPVVR